MAKAVDSIDEPPPPSKQTEPSKKKGKKEEPEKKATNLFLEEAEGKEKEKEKGEDSKDESENKKGEAEAKEDGKEKEARIMEIIGRYVPENPDKDLMAEYLTPIEYVMGAFREIVEHLTCYKILQVEGDGNCFYRAAIKYHFPDIPRDWEDMMSLNLRKKLNPNPEEEALEEKKLQEGVLSPSSLSVLSCSPPTLIYFLFTEKEREREKQEQQEQEKEKTKPAQESISPRKEKPTGGFGGFMRKIVDREDKKKQPKKKPAEKKAPAPQEEAPSITQPKVDFFIYVSSLYFFVLIR